MKKLTLLLVAAAVVLTFNVTQAEEKKGSKPAAIAEANKASVDLTVSGMR